MSILDLQIHAIRLRNHVFGPPYTADEITILRTQAQIEDWTEFLDNVQKLPRRKRRWWVHYLKTGTVKFVTLVPLDPYDDDDPFEIDG